MGENIVDGGDGRAAGSRPPSRIHATGPVPLSLDHAKPTPMPGRYVSLGDARCLHCHVDQKKNTTGIRGLIRAPVPLPAPPERVGGISGFSHCVSGRSLVWVGRGFVCAKLFVGAAFCWRGFLLARLRADDGRNDGHQDKERTMPLSPCMEGSMAGREPCTDTLFASEDLLCLSPEDDLRPPARETLSVSPYEGENLVLEVSETPALASLPFIG